MNVTDRLVVRGSILSINAPNWLGLRQVGIHQPVINIDTHDRANDRHDEWDQPVAASPQSLCPHQRSKDTRTKVTGRIDCVTAWATQAQTNGKHCAANQEW